MDQINVLINDWKKRNSEKKRIQGIIDRLDDAYSSLENEKKHIKNKNKNIEDMIEERTWKGRTRDDFEGLLDRLKLYLKLNSGNLNLMMDELLDDIRTYKNEKHAQDRLIGPIEDALTDLDTEWRKWTN